MAAAGRLLLFLPSLAVLVGADAPSPPPVPDAEIVVTASRLPDEPSPSRDLPAEVTVVTRETLEALGARTVQDALALETGAVLYDQSGNGVQTILDWRGFSSGTGSAVFLDGARINDPRNNAVALESVPVDAVDRIEITRGPAAALAGGGSESAVIQIFTRPPGTPSGSVTAAGGSDATGRLVGSFSGASGRLGLSASASLDRTDGFRENGASNRKRYAAAASWDLGSGRTLEAGLVGDRSRYGTPGSVTLAEFDADPYAAPYNRDDYTDGSTTQMGLSFRGPVGRGLTVSANVYHRDARDRSLSTGRAATMFGGFFLDATTGSTGVAAQVTHDLARGAATNRLTAGIEGLHGSADSLGRFTPASDPGTVPDAPPDSSNIATTRNAAIYVQDAWKPSPRWTLLAGARHDEVRIRYEESVPDPTVRDARTFSRTSLRAGAVFQPAPPVDVYASYGEAFLPPTAEQLFAFPLFGSNRDLAPQRSRSIEAGARLRRERIQADAAAFRIATDDEIVFDPAPAPGNPYGMNVNAGSTRRTGLEASIRGRIAARVDGWIKASRTRAVFASGANDGKTAPLVPRDRAAVGLDARLPAGFGLRGDLLYVGRQVLLNDDANAQAPLPAYAVLDARATWSPARKAERTRGAWTLFLEASNLLDRKYATRGIYAYDFVAGDDAAFVTPAAGRRIFGGGTWSY